MTYQDIINLVAAGFTKNDIASMVQPQVQPQQVQPQQVQPQVQPQVQTQQPTQTEADMLAIIQRINATQAGFDIPPARTSSDILSDHLMEMFDSNRNSQNGTTSSDQKGK